jgi:hypothetical protein
VGILVVSLWRYSKVMVAEGNQKYSGIVNIPDTVLNDGTKYAVEAIDSKASIFCLHKEQTLNKIER